MTTLNNIQKRFLLFLGICIPLRFVIAYVAKIIPLQLLPLLGIPFLIFGLVFMYLFLTNSRTTGAETMGDIIWWNDLRPLHAGLHILFAVMAFKRNPQAWKVLIVDTSIGLIAFFAYHISQHNMSKLV
jgi:hypothetical protein